MVLALDSPAMVASDTREQTWVELTPSDEGIRLWLVDLDACVHDEASAWLSPDECDRASRFVFTRDAQRYRAAHAVLRRLLHQHDGLPERTEFAISAHGKPRLARAEGCDFNLSHSGSNALIGISTKGHVGVDIELLRSIDDVWPLAEQTLSAGECDALRCAPHAAQTRAFLRGWTRKEACLKAVGSGLSIDPSSFHAGLEAYHRDVFIDTDSGPIHVRVQTVELGAGLLAAVAVVIGSRLADAALT